MAVRQVGKISDMASSVDTDHLTEPVAAWDLYDMIQAFLQTPSYHVIFEVALILWIVSLMFTKSYKTQKTDLSEKEKNDLIEDWQPEPLVPETAEDEPALHNMKNRVVESKLAKYIKVNGRKCLNVASLNFLGMVGRHDIEEVAAESINQYGVGSCGPRGFYGTVDVHLTLEERLAKFMKQEEGIIYSYGFSTIASAIPAYSKRGDVLFVDDGVHFAIQKGIQASRSKICYFKHNDMEDLERLLLEQADQDRKNPKKAKVTRRFFLVEGLYMKTGDICPLPKLLELKHKFKVRIFMDESFSIGTLGKTGRGLTEHFNVSADEICLITGSLEYAFGSTGGFCVGATYVVDHQRLSGLGYCFSASTPPMLTKAATKALDILEQNPKLLSMLNKNCKYMHSLLNKHLYPLQVENCDSNSRLVVDKDDNGEFRLERVKLINRSHICLIDEFLCGHRMVCSEMNAHRCQEESTLYSTHHLDISDQAEEHGVALTLASFLNEELVLPPPSIRIAVTCDLTEEEMDQVVNVIKSSIGSALEGLENINDISS